MILIRNIHKSFGAQVVLAGISLEIEAGKITAILGPSGTGKSVLLKIITGLERADEGEVYIYGSSMTDARSVREREEICAQMGVLFQRAALFDSMSLYENVAFPLRHRFDFKKKSLSESEIKKRVFRRLKEVSMESYANKLPGEVSIGMRKRIGIARALVTDPRIILFDEPNTGLDPEVGQEIYDLIVETQKTGGFTGIIVSHEIPEVFQACDRVAMLYQGLVQEEGSVEEFLASEKPAVKQFIKGDIVGPINMV